VSDETPAVPTPPVVAPGAEIGRLERLSDRINPILVREVLQSLGGRTFVITLGLSLAAIVIVALAVAGSNVGDDAGFNLLQTSLMLLAPIALFVVPLQAFVAMRAEVRAGTREQLLLSRLSPAQIVRGKLFAALIQFTLFMSIFAPLVAMTFLLRGVDVPMIVTSLYYGILLAVVVTAAAIALGSMAAEPAVHVVLLGVAALGLAGITMSVIGVLGSRFVFGMGVTTRPGWIELTEMFLSAAAFVVFFGLIAAAFVKHPVENRSTPFRVYMLLFPILWSVWILATSEAGLVGDAFAWMAGTCLGTFWMFWLFAATEEDQLSPRAASIVRRRPLISRLFFPLLPGGGRGVVFGYGWLMMVLILAAFGPALRGESLPARANAAFAYLAACSAVFVGLARLVRLPLPRGWKGTRLARLLVPAIGLIGAFVPLLVANMLRTNPWDVVEWSPFHALNVPFTMNRIEGVGLTAVSIGLLVVALALLLANGPGIVRGYTEVARLVATRTAEPREDDAS